MQLHGKTAIVTGGGKGIGRGVVDRFLEEGARVAIVQRSPLEGALARHADVLHVEADLADATAFDHVVASVVDWSGAVDVLVNNAGVMYERTLDRMTLDEWERMIAVNLRGPVFLAKAALPQLKDSAGGSIINIGSAEGLAANPGHTAYSASKGGLHSATRAMAVDLGVHGIRVNAIAPGWITSPLSEEYVDSLSDPTAARHDLTRMHPVGRLGMPRDVGDAAVFLASDHAGFITGETLVLDGGRTIKLPTPE